MTFLQMQMVKRSWHVFQSIDPELIGDVFYGKLFLSEPRLQHLFITSPEDQSRKLVEMLNLIVGRLDRLEELKNEIRSLAIRHVRYGVQPSHYQAVGEALLWTLQQGLGKDWDDEVREAWSCCYDLIAGAMIEAST
jgi:hemoglobin-like flavoprotein